MSLNFTLFSLGNALVSLKEYETQILVGDASFSLLKLRVNWKFKHLTSFSFWEYFLELVASASDPVSFAFPALSQINLDLNLNPLNSLHKQSAWTHSLWASVRDTGDLGGSL